MKKGIIITIEGTDGCGKATQTKLLAEALKEVCDKPVRTLSFPRYGNPSCAMVEKYLGGAFGSDPESVNPYTASSFYAIDRIVSYLEDWKPFYEAGGIILTDRYTISNAIHQAEKLDGDKKWAYLEWLYDFEYNKLGLPAPDKVFFLDVPADISAKLRQMREEKTGTNPDIHERDRMYLARCRQSALSLAYQSSWHVINCAKEGKLRSIDDIHLELLHETQFALREMKLQSQSPHA